MILDIVYFGIAAVMIAVGGTAMAGLADRLADRTGLGEALMGGVFLGVSTSLPGISASVTAAAEGFAGLAISNAMGGIAVQTAFLAVADLFYRRANLEHAAASAPNLIQGTLLIGLLSLLGVFITGPEITLWHVHYGTPLLVAAYVLGLRLAFRSGAKPMWSPRKTPETVEDRPEERSFDDLPLSRLWMRFALAAGAVMAGGVVVAHVGGRIVSETGFEESLMGGVFTAISTSLPELVTTIAAVRRGALTLAVGDIVGGNAFDVLFVCAADVAYLRGSIFGAAGRPELFLTGLTIVLNVLVLLGMLHRQRKGPVNIGFESVLVLAVYVAGIAGLVALGGT